MDRFEDTKLRIKEATDLVALIESYLPLKPRGRTLVALCPFHAEGSPSFTVFRESQHFHCFGCGKTGDCFTWLMERDGLTFREAMEVLADRAGVSLDGVFRNQRQEPRKGPDPYQALAAVAGFFAQQLLTPAGRLARDYLTARGLADAIEPWRLGYHPEQGALTRFAQAQQVPRDVLEGSGLLKNGREIFAGRLMFPIDDERGRTVGFGGRLVPGAPGSDGDGDYKPPKYLNSPESPLFNKRRVLFGLHRAKQAGQRRIVVMEGYTDVIACHLAGFTGAVASLGTAFTADHARMVERYATQGLVLMFDGDRAGLQAAERAMRELMNSRLPVRIALMGDASGNAKDPADVVVARPGEDPELVGERRARFADVLDGAEDALTVWFRLLRKRLDLTQAVHLETAARECASLLALVTEPVRREGCLQDMARHLAVPAATLERLLQKQRRPEAAGRDGRAEAEAAAGPVRPQPLSPAQRVEHDLLAAVLAKPVLLASIDVVGDAPLQSPEIAQLLAMANDGALLGRVQRDDLLKYLFARAAERPDLLQLLGAAADRAARLPDAEAVLRGLVDGRRRLGNEGRRRALRQQLQQALALGDRATADRLQQELLTNLREDRPRPGRAEPTAAPPPS